MNIASERRDHLVNQSESKNLGTGGVKKSILLSSGKIFVLQGLGMFLSFCLQALISHACGVAAVGGFALFAAWLGILSIITVPGLEGTLVFFLPRFENDPNSRYKVVRFCLVAVAAISCSVALVVVGLGSQVYSWIGLPLSARIPFAITIITFSLSKLLDALFLGVKDAPAASYFNVIRTILRLLFCLPAFLFPRAGWTIVLVSLVCEGCATLAFRAIKTYRQHPELVRKPPSHLNGERLQNSAIVSTSAPMFGISVTDGLYPFLDKAILGAMLPLEIVGIYRIADSVASLNSAFVAPFVSFWPYISKLYKEGRMKELCDAYRSINLVIIALLIPFFLVLTQLSGWVLSLFGPVFAQQGRTVLLVLSFGCVIDAIAGPAGAVLKMTKHSRLSLVINSVLLVIYIAVSVGLGKAYGVIGIAAARATVMALGNIANVTANYVLLRVFPYSWKHGWLLMSGALIFAATFVVGEPLPSTRSQVAMALNELLLFLLIASVVLKSHFGYLVGLTKKWMFGQQVIASL